MELSDMDLRCTCDMCAHVEHNQRQMEHAVLIGLRRGLGLDEDWSCADLLDALGFGDPPRDVAGRDIADAVSMIVRSARRG